MNNLLDIALEHHKAGRAVIALTDSKKPLHSGWDQFFKRRQTRAEVEQEFSNGAAGIGLILWPACSLAVLDFDGTHARAAWATTGIELPETGRIVTRSGGEHLYFRTPADPPELRRKVRIVTAECSCKKKCGVDFLVSGYSVCPPTRGYKEDPDHVLESTVMIPSEILKLAAKPKSEDRRTGNVEGKVSDGQRKATLCSLAGTMRARGMSIEAIAAALKADNEARFDPPLDDSEIEDVLKSAGDGNKAATNRSI